LEDILQQFPDFLTLAITFSARMVPDGDWPYVTLVFELAKLIVTS
jgi:hypothetical protein